MEGIGFYIMLFALIWVSCTFIGLLYDSLYCLLYYGKHDAEYQDMKDNMFAITFLPIINMIYCVLIFVKVVILLFTPSTYATVFKMFKKVFK